MHDKKRSPIRDFLFDNLVKIMPNLAKYDKSKPQFLTSDAYLGGEYMVSEFVHGTMPVFNGSERDGRLTAMHLAKELATVHDLGVTHNDVKPQNYLLGESGKVTLIDWEFAQTINPNARLDISSDWKDEHIAFFCGSPLYMPPEQARGSKTDEKADSYRLACNLSLLTSGETPHHQHRGLLRDPTNIAAEVEFLRRIMKYGSQITFARDRIRDKRTQDLVVSCMAAPENRPTVREMATELADVV